MISPPHDAKDKRKCFSSHKRACFRREYHHLSTMSPDILARFAMASFHSVIKRREPVIKPALSFFSYALSEFKTLSLQNILEDRVRFNRVCFRREYHRARQTVLSSTLILRATSTRSFATHSVHFYSSFPVASLTSTL